MGAGVVVAAILRERRARVKVAADMSRDYSDSATVRELIEKLYAAFVKSNDLLTNPRVSPERQEEIGVRVSFVAERSLSSEEGGLAVSERSAGRAQSVMRRKTSRRVANF